MKTFVQYLDKNGVDACGDRSIVILDGRNKLPVLIEDARIMNGYHRPFYPKFQIRKGERFLEYTNLTEILEA